MCGSPNQHLELHVKLYCFAEKICQDDLMDCIMTSIIMRCRKGNFLPGWKAMEYIYQNTGSSSLLRKFMSFSCLYVLLEGKEEKWPMSQLCEVTGLLALRTDVFQLLRSGEKGTDPKTLPLCKFHKHKEGEACPYDKEVP